MAFATVLSTRSYEWYSTALVRLPDGMEVTVQYDGTAAGLRRVVAATNLRRDSHTRDKEPVAPGTQIDVGGSAPPPSNEPSDPGSGYLWNDSFDYADYAAGVSAGALTGSSGTTSLITGRTGGKAVRISIPSDPSNGSGWNPSGQGRCAAFTPPSGAVVVQYYVRYSTDWQCSGSGFKNLYQYYSNDEGRTELSPIGNGTTRFTVNPFSNSVGYQPIGPYTSGLADGLWHRITWQHRPNTTAWQIIAGPAGFTTSPPSSRDGEEIVWIDGTKVMWIAAAAVDVTPAGGDRPWCYSVHPTFGWHDVDTICQTKTHQFMFPGNYPNPPVACTEDRDDFKAWGVA